MDTMVDWGAITDGIAQAFDEGYKQGKADAMTWIPISKQLPKCNGVYLVWRPHFFGGKIGMPSICYFDGSDTWHDSYGVDFERTLHQEDVTHWMPLPEPPMDGEDINALTRKDGD